MKSRLREPTARHDAARSTGSTAADPGGQLRAERLATPVPGRIFGGPAQSTVDPLGGSPVESSVAAALRRRQGAGRPLPEGLGSRMESHLGQDLSQVRVHDDPEAARITASLQALAFTHGNDLYFARGAYQPNNDRGLQVLTHEVGHVVAQRSGLDRGGPGPLTVGRADDPAERLADRAAGSTLAALRRPAGREG